MTPFIIEVTEICTTDGTRRVMLPLSSIIAIKEPDSEGGLVIIVTMDLHRFEICESYDQIRGAILCLQNPISYPTACSPSD